MFDHFWLFLQAVWVHAITLAAGCVVTVVLGIIEKRVLRRPISLRVEIGILLAFVFFACFQAWRDQYEIAAKVNQAPPIQITNQVTVPPAPAPIVNFPAQMAYVASSDLDFQGAQLKVGEHISVRSWCKNISPSIPAENVTCFRGAFVVDTTPNAANQPMVEESVQNKTYVKFERRIAPIKGLTDTYGPGESRWGTGYTESVFDNTLAKAFEAGTKTILFAGEYRWHDGTGKHSNQVCAWVQMGPDVSSGKSPVVWNYCLHHNGLKSPPS
jgi:hypothetical protein